VSLIAVIVAKAIARWHAVAALLALLTTTVCYTAATLPQHHAIISVLIHCYNSTSSTLSSPSGIFSPKAVANVQQARAPHESGTPGAAVELSSSAALKNVANPTAV
jgi:hypothetical protein